MLSEGIKAAQAGDRGNARSSFCGRSGSIRGARTAGFGLHRSANIRKSSWYFSTMFWTSIPAMPGPGMDAGDENADGASIVQRGMVAIDDNDRDLARECFNNALEQDQTNAAAWQWLAEISEPSDEKISCLEQVLALEPGNAAAEAALTAARSEITEKLLADAKSFAVAGRRVEALEVLGDLLEKSPASADAWILRSHLVESFEEKLSCFDTILAFNPQNAAAVAGRESC